MEALLEVILEFAAHVGFEWLLGIFKDDERKKQEDSSPNNDPATPEV